MTKTVETAQPCCTCKTGKALHLAGGICLIAGALLALVFAFFIGNTLTMTIPKGYYTDESETVVTSMIWDDFGPSYKSLATLFEAMEEYSGHFQTSFYLPTVISTIVGAGTLVAVIALSVIAALKYGAHFKNPSAKYEKYALAAIITFIAGALAYYTINGVSLNTLTASTSYDRSITITVTPSAITKTGMILVGVLVGAYFVLKVASQGKALADKGAIPNLVFTVCSLVFTAIALSFVIEVIAQVSGWKTITAELNFQAITVALATLNQENALKANPAEIDGYAAAYGLSATLQFLQIAVIAAIVVVLIQKISHYPSQKRTGMIESIVLCALTLLYFILTCVCISETNYYLNEMSGTSMDQDYVTLLSAPIALLVAAVLNVAVAVLNKVVLSWDKLTAKKAKPQAEAPVTAEEPAPVETNEPTEE
ncbi:MAG: chloride channel protein [Clostridia bacterium]|nr:chloride channel protein [Clostridia bacterium]